MSGRNDNGRHRLRLMEVTLWFVEQPAVPKLKAIVERWACAEPTAVRWRSAWLAVQAKRKAEARSAEPCHASR